MNAQIARRGLDFPDLSILHLVDETLGMIFEEIWRSNSNGAKKLLLVCKRFRDVAIRQPVLWMQLTTNKDPTLFLERSGSLPLEVDVYFSHGVHRVKSFLHLPKPHARRWSHFTLNHRPGDPPLRRFFQWMDRQYRDLRFDRLRTMRLRFFENEQVFNIVRSDKRDVTGFFRTWTLPALVNFNGLRLQPRINAEKLEKCSVLLIHDAGFQNNFRALATTIYSSYQNLKKLTLSIQTVNNPLHDIVEMPFKRELVALDTLRLEFQANAVALRKLLATISAPNLKELSLNLLHSDEVDAREQLETLFPKAQPRWPALEALSATFLYADFLEHDEAEESPLDVLFSRLPRLKHLDVVSDIPRPKELKMDEVFGQYNGTTRPPLQSLILGFPMIYNCDTSFLLEIQDVLCSPDFNMLEIQGCDIDVKRIKNVLPDFEYTWLASKGE